ncbi:unnamed protein product, partial [Prorocentrum cordatum]
QSLWVVANGAPSARDDDVRSVEGLTRARGRWLLYPEKKTAGMPGLLPLCAGMPVQFADAVNFEFGACKRAAGVVHGRALCEADARMVREVHAEAEVVLREVPVAMRVKLHGQAKVFSPGLPLGVFPLKPKTMSWGRGAGGGAAVKRAGFTAAPHFASTAHAVTGATPPTAVVDLLGVARAPRADDVPPSYVALSRVRTADDILIAQALPPALFRMGHQRGPWLLSSIVDGSVTIEDAEAKWAEKTAPTRKRLLELALPCAACRQSKALERFWVPECSALPPAGACEGAADVQRPDPLASELRCFECGRARRVSEYDKKMLGQLRSDDALERAACPACRPAQLRRPPSKICA